MTASVRPLSMLFFLTIVTGTVFSSSIYYAESTEDGCRANGWVLQGVEASTGTICKGNQPYSNGTFIDNDGNKFTCVCVLPNQFESILKSFWWCLVTMTPGGYGDMVPDTIPGHLLAVATMFWGLIVLALPITVIGTNFARVLREMQAENMLSTLDNLDKNGDGEADISEVKRLIQAIKSMGLEGAEFQNAEALVAAYDMDGNGMLSPEELEHLREDLNVITGFRDYKERTHTEMSSKQLVKSMTEKAKMRQESITRPSTRISPEGQDTKRPAGNENESNSSTSKIASSDTIPKKKTFKETANSDIEGSREPENNKTPLDRVYTSGNIASTLFEKIDTIESSIDRQLEAMLATLKAMDDRDQMRLRLDSTQSM